MMRSALFAALTCGLLVGCQSERFSSVQLGEVGYDHAFRLSRETFRDYYSIARADRAAGRILGRPKEVTRKADWLVTAPQARELAELRLRSEAGVLWADLRVMVQKQESYSYAGMSGLTTQHDIPDQTPAQLDAPFTANQEEIWEDTGSDRSQERRILDDLYKRLHPTPQP